MLQRDGYEPILTKDRWCLLERPENLTKHQEVRLEEILQYNLQERPGASAPRGLAAVL